MTIASSLSVRQWTILGLSGLLILATVLFFGATQSRADSSSVMITSNNANSMVAKVGDTVTLSFTTDASSTNPTATIDGHTVGVSGGPTNWTATYTLQSSDAVGAVPFSVTTDTGTVTSSTNGSYVTFYNAQPTVVLSSPTAQSGTHIGVATVPVVATFSEPVTNVSAASFHTGNATISNFQAQAGGTVYTFNLDLASPSGDYQVNMNGGSVTDAAGDANVGSNQLSFTFDPSMVGTGGGTGTGTSSTTASTTASSTGSTSTSTASSTGSTSTSTASTTDSTGGSLTADQIAALQAEIAALEAELSASGNCGSSTVAMLNSIASTTSATTTDVTVLQNEITALQNLLTTPGNCVTTATSTATTSSSTDTTSTTGTGSTGYISGGVSGGSIYAGGFSSAGGTSGGTSGSMTGTSGTGTTGSSVTGTTGGNTTGTGYDGTTVSGTSYTGTTGSSMSSSTSGLIGTSTDLLGSSTSSTSQAAAAGLTGLRSPAVWAGIIIILLLLIGGGWWYSRNVTPTV